MKKFTTIFAILALAVAFGCSDNQLLNPQQAEVSSTAVTLAKASKTSILHITGTGTQYLVREDGSKILVGPIDYGHLIEVSENALEAHFAHGDVTAKEAHAVNDGKYVRESDVFKGSPGQSSSVWLSF